MSVAAGVGSRPRPGSFLSSRPAVHRVAVDDAFPRRMIIDDEGDDFVLLPPCSSGRSWGIAFPCDFPAA